MKIKAVALDIDGTLYSSPRFYARVAGFALANWRVFREFAALRHELHRAAADPARRSSFPRDGASFRRAQARLFAGRLGMDEAAAGALVEKVLYRDLDELFARVRLYPGLLDCLDALRDGGLRLATLSDFPVRRKLEILGLSERFEVARCSEDSGLLKPAPEPFLDLARDLGLEPAEILYVGNHPRYDVLGSVGAGMVAAYRGRGPAPGASLRFTDWSELSSFALSRA